MTKLPEGALAEFGGHELAGGFSVGDEAIHFLEEKLVAAYQDLQKEKANDAVFRGKDLDGELTLDDVRPETFVSLNSLAPFGMLNPKPLFVFQRITPVSVSLFGKEKNHLELVFKNSKGRMIKAIAFFKKPGDFKTTVEENIPLNLIGSLELSHFGGREELRLRIENIV